MKSYSLEIGKPVFQVYRGLLRFGTIKSRMTDKDGWAHFYVDWTSDEKYERAMDEAERYSNKPKTREYYRCDEIYLLNTERLETVSNFYKEQSQQ